MAKDFTDLLGEAFTLSAAFAEDIVARNGVIDPFIALARANVVLTAIKEAMDALNAQQPKQ